MDKKEQFEKVLKVLNDKLSELNNKIEELYIMDWDKKKKIQIDDKIYTVSFTIKKRIALEKAGIDNHYFFYESLKKDCKNIKDFTIKEDMLKFISIMYNVDMEEIYNYLPPSNFDLCILINALLDIYYYDMKMYEIEKTVLENQIDFTENIIVYGEEKAKEILEQEKESNKSEKKNLI